MALFHSNAQVISRSSGRSSVAAAAYRSGAQLTNERDGMTHDYSSREDVVFSEVALPAKAPKRWLDRSALWNDVERSEKSRNAQLAREINYALPRELSRGEQIELVREYAKGFTSAGMVADYSVHDSGEGNPHCHLMLSMRPCDEEGFTAKSENLYLARENGGSEKMVTADEFKTLGDGWAKVYVYRGGEELTQEQAAEAGLDPTRDRRRKQPVQTTRYLIDWNEPDKVEQWRGRLADIENAYLERASSDERVDHRSYEEQGIDQIATLHEGPRVHRAEQIARERAKVGGYAYSPVTQRGAENARIGALNVQLRRLAEKLRRELRELRHSLPDLAIQGAVTAVAGPKVGKAVRQVQRYRHQAKRSNGMSR